MPNLKDTKEFHYSTSNELNAIKDRVRILVDHWGEDGRYKEAILKAVIKKFLPEKFSVVTGFVVKQHQNRGNHTTSPQIDLIIYDNSYPTLFKEGDFAILTADAVKAIIEVKADLRKQKYKKVIKKCNTIGKFIVDEQKRILQERTQLGLTTTQLGRHNRFFNGIFSFNGFNKSRYQHIENYIKSESVPFKTDNHFDLFCVNHISFNENLFYKYWQTSFNQRADELRNWICKIENLSYTFFISNLLEYICSDSIRPNNFLWFPTDKSYNVVKSFNF